MKLAQALKKVRSLKNELSRLLKMRQENFVVVIPKGSDIKKSKKDIDFLELTEQIKTVVAEITELRGNILRTNISTFVKLNEKDVSLAVLKLKIDDFRSELAQAQQLKNIDGMGRMRRPLLTTDTEEKEVPQLTDMEIEAYIKGLESQKDELDSVLEAFNNKTDLFE